MLQSVSAHSLSFSAISGGDLPLAQFEGKLLLVVNTASKCGFTPQYQGLEALHQREERHGLVILGVPSNSFGRQEPGTEEQIQSFCSTRYQVSFPMTAKVDIRGKDAHPFYDWIRARAGWRGAPRWNFYKYLISPDGDLIDWFSPMTKPLSAKLARAIEQNRPR